jgi:SHS2 domain-containing protein
MGSSRGTIGHTADLKFWVEADSLEELFCSAPIALAELMYQGPRKDQPWWQSFSAQGDDSADLMVQLLSEVVYLADAEAKLVAGMEIARLSESSLDARLGLVRLDPKIHELNEPVKAVTYHQASVAPMDSRWRCEIVLDV